jgi:hypothetical protein
MFRRPPVRRRGLVGTMATTAVVAGTATAVSHGMSSRYEKKEMAAQQEQAAQQAAFDSQQQIADMQQQMASMQAQQAQAAAPPPAAAAGSADLMAQLQQLAELKQTGVLTDAEFEAAKAKLLSAQQAP